MPDPVTGENAALDGTFQGSLNRKLLELDNNLSEETGLFPTWRGINTPQLHLPAAIMACKPVLADLLTFKRHWKTEFLCEIFSLSHMVWNCKITSKKKFLHGQNWSSLQVSALEMNRSSDWERGTWKQYERGLVLPLTWCVTLGK